MFKNKLFWAIIAVFLLNIYSNNISFAIDNVSTENIYPDYSCEFAGKDTCEKFNRKLFVFNLKLNKYLLRPVNIVWASIVPKYGMDRLQNAYTNMNYPIRLVSCLLQKDFKSSGTETVRFLTNTTLGIGGLYDPAFTKFKIEARQEDMGQALAHFKIKSGPYLVLPVVRGNVRDLVGQLLDCPLRPTSYVGPFGAVATGVFAVNNTTCLQPVFKKIDETYADPYEIAKQIDGLERYIKNSNLDRSEVFKEKTASENIINISENSENKTSLVQPDIKLNNFNPQGSLVDSLRTAMFDNQKIDHSIWSDMSVWNKTFGKKIKTASVNITQNRPDYKYKYTLQADKSAPLAIIYPSIGEGITSDKSVVLAKILYDEGYSVLIQGSAFQWEFVKSMPDGYKPGFPAQDAKYLRQTTAKIIENIQNKKECKGLCKFDKKILVGCSFGALTGIFTAAQEEDAQRQGESTIGISKYIAINPPVDLIFALKQLDGYSQNWKKNPSDVKLRTAITAQKVIGVYKNINGKTVESMPESMPFVDDEAKLTISFIMKQKLSDVVFAIENYSRGTKSNLSETINKMSFNDYAQKYLFVNNQTDKQFNYDTSLYSLANFLGASDKYKIYHSIDDYFVNDEQLLWLKKCSNKNSVFFSNGSHLGFLYRKEFIDEFKKDINLQNTVDENENNQGDKV